MTRILNFGSLNYDFVYSVDKISKEGETISSEKMEIYPGGKGLNQSIALARAGACVSHAGLMGEDGYSLRDNLNDNGVDTKYLKQTDGKNGHAMIQVDSKGQNSIVLYGGSNQKNTEEFVDSVLNNFSKGDFLLLQNEVNCLSYIIDKAWERGLTIVLNPSPFNGVISKCKLEKITYFILNEIEGKNLTGKEDAQAVLDCMRERYVNSRVVLTLGKKGCLYADEAVRLYQPALKVEAIDTTAAGDTFTGYFLASVMAEDSVSRALAVATTASSLAVMCNGASSSIPNKNQVYEKMNS